jgi:SAM-dependent methyltransferase
MTDAQLAKARRLAADAAITNVEFREGYIERPPVDDRTFDCVISNGVINLSPDKAAVFAAAARALRPGGCLALADIVTDVQLPEGVTCDASLWVACIGGAMQRDHYRTAIEDAGLQIEVWRENPHYRLVSEQASSRCSPERRHHTCDSPRLPCYRSGCCPPPRRTGARCSARRGQGRPSEQRTTDRRSRLGR